MATETCLKDKVWLLGSWINKGEFRCLPSNRTDTTKGGGLAIIYKAGSGIKCIMIDSGEKSSFQYAVWKLEIKNKVLTMIRVYHPPTNHHADDSNAKFITKVLDFMSDPQLESKNTVILGDFYLHVNNESDTDAQLFIDMVKASGLKQWIDFPTHK